MSDGSARRAKRQRESDASATRRNILDVATAEFSELGLSGARVHAIAERTKTSKRMIYYYFGSKEGLYLAVLEEAYERIRSVEGNLRLLEQPPLDAIKTLIARTFDHDEENPDFVRLVSIENIHKAKHMAISSSIARLNAPIIDTLRQILDRGRQSGVFRSDLDPIEVHMLISALCFFRVSNRYTFGMIFERDLSEPKTRDRHRQLISEVVLSYLKPVEG